MSRYFTASLRVDSQLGHILPREQRPSGFGGRAKDQALRAFDKSHIKSASERPTYHQDVQTANNEAHETRSLLKLHDVFAEDGARDPALYDAEDAESM